MHKIITKRDIRQFVKENVEDLPEQTLQLILEKKNIPYKEGLKKATLINIIEYHKIDLWFVYHMSKNEAFGVTKKRLLQILDCKKEFLEKLLSEGVIKEVYEKNDIKYYSLEDVYDLSEEKLAKFKSKRNRLTGGKNLEQKSKIKVVKSIEGRLRDAQANKGKWTMLLDNEKYIIVCLGATGANTEVDEIIALSITDVRGNILFNETFLTEKRIGAGGYHINEKMEETATVKFKDCIKRLEEILKNKIVIGYEVDFSIEMLKNSGYTKKIKTYNLMTAYMEYVHSKYVIRFKRALNMQKLSSGERQSTLEDCTNTFNLIIAVIKECNQHIKELEDSMEGYRERQIVLN